MAPKTPGSRWASPEAQVSTTPTRRIIWRSYGPQKSGKTRFGLTGPQPVFIQSFDIGLEGTIEQFLAEGKDIRALEYPFDPQSFDTEKACAIAADKIWQQFIADYDAALKEARTILWDTESEVWELLRYARLGAVSGAPKDYAVLNGEYRTLVRKAYGAGVNLGLIQKVKEQWVSKMDPQKGKMVPHNTGEMVPTGMKEIGFLVQVNLRHFREFNEEKQIVYRTEIEDVRHNDGQYMVGMVMDNFDFPQLAEGIFPDSKAEDWQ
jgi:hypothetical protein